MSTSITASTTSTTTTWLHLKLDAQVSPAVIHGLLDLLAAQDDAVHDAIFEELHATLMSTLAIP